MKAIAVKFWSQAEYNPQETPGYWPWIKKTIDSADTETYESLGYTVYTEKQYADYLELNSPEFEKWLHQGSTKLIVISLVHEMYRDYHPCKIDFARHLKPNVALNKKVTMLRNGRPQKADYYYGPDKICTITFDFTVTASNFVTRRKEFLTYYKFDGTPGDTYLIRDKIFDMSNFADMAERVEERVTARQYIMREIKAVIGAAMDYHYTTLPPEGEKLTPQQVWTMAGAFWSALSPDIDAWYNTATSDFSTKLVEAVDFPFLDKVIPTSISRETVDKTIRQYMIDRIVY